MAKELEVFPETRGRGKTGESKYPWDEWFNGKIWQLDAGEDFDIKMVSMKSIVSKTAKDRGVRVKTATVNDGKSLVIQQVGPLAGS